MRKVFAVISLVVSTFLFSGLSYAGGTEEAMEELLFTEAPIIRSAGFFAKSVTDAPGYSTVISAKQIQESPVRDLRDVTNYFAPGMSELIHEMTGPMNAVRGVGVDSNAKTLYMLDGQHLNHYQHFGYTTETAVPLLGDIAQVEIVNGPGAIVHGSGAISGYVNMVPKNGKDDAGFTASGEYGFDDELYKTEMGYGKDFSEGKNLYVYAGLLQANGSKSGSPWVINGSTIESNAQLSPSLYKLRANAFPDPTYKLAAYLNYDNFSLNAFYRQETYVPNAAYYRDGNGGEKCAWRTGSLGIRPKYTFEINETDSLDLIGSLIFMEMGHDPDSTLWAVPGTPGVPLAANVDEQSFNADKESHMELKGVIKTTRFQGHSLAGGGLVGKRNFGANDTYFRDHSKSVQSTGEAQTSSWTEYAVFAEDVMDLTDLLTVSLGWRYDEVRFSPITSLSNNFRPKNSENTSWRAASAYKLDDTSNIKLSYQEGFRNLHLGAFRWYSFFNDSLRNLGYSEQIKTLEPETMNSTELNYHKEFKEAKLKIDVNLYNNVYNKMIHWHTFTTSNTAGLTGAAVTAVRAANGWMGAHINAPGKFTSRGFEVVGSWQATDKTLVNLSYGYSRPMNVPDDVDVSLNLFTEDNNDWTLYPTHQIKGNIVTKLLDDKLTLSLAPLYQSPVKVLEVTDNTSSCADIYGHPRYVFDVAGEYKITKKLSTKLTIKNLFEENVPVRTFKLKPYQGALGTNNRHWYLSMKYSF